MRKQGNDILNLGVGLLKKWLKLPLQRVVSTSPETRCMTIVPHSWLHSATSSKFNFFHGRLYDSATFIHSKRWKGNDFELSKTLVPRKLECEINIANQSENLIMWLC